MPVLAPDTARVFAAEWIEAWNTHDLDRVLRHYTEDVKFTSPFVISIAGEPSGTIQGKDALRTYWAKALALLPDLHFDLIDVLAGVSVVTIYYRGHRGNVAETFHFDAHAKVCSATACYGIAR
jgi:hypothetical protein